MNFFSFVKKTIRWYFYCLAALVALNLSLPGHYVHGVRTGVPSIAMYTIKTIRQACMAYYSDRPEEKECKLPALRKEYVNSLHEPKDWNFEIVNSDIEEFHAIARMEDSVKKVKVSMSPVQVEISTLYKDIGKYRKSRFENSW